MWGVGGAGGAGGAGSIRGSRSLPYRVGKHEVTVVHVSHVVHFATTVWGSRGSREHIREQGAGSRGSREHEGYKGNMEVSPYSVREVRKHEVSVIHVSRVIHFTSTVRGAGGAGSSRGNRE